MWCKHHLFVVHHVVQADGLLESCEQLQEATWLTAQGRRASQRAQQLREAAQQAQQAAAEKIAEAEALDTR